MPREGLVKPWWGGMGTWAGESTQEPEHRQRELTPRAATAEAVSGPRPWEGPCPAGGRKGSLQGEKKGHTPKVENDLVKVLVANPEHSVGLRWQRG